MTLFCLFSHISVFVFSGFVLAALYMLLTGFHSNEIFHKLYVNFPNASGVSFLRVWNHEFTTGSSLNIAKIKNGLGQFLPILTWIKMELQE